MRRRKLFLASAIVINLTVLGFFKYVDFLVRSFAGLIQTIQLDVANLADGGSVMISNDRGHEHARSSGELHEVVLKKLR